MGERLASLDAIEAALWRELLRAPNEPGHAWRTPVLATTDGAAADARTVILREVDEARRELLIYTDARAPKVAQAMNHPLGTLVMWSPALGWQLRCRVRLGFEDDGLSVASRWAALRHSHAAQDYLSSRPPGAPADAAVPAAEQRAYFGVLTAVVQSIDWLELHRDGHRRALFDDRGGRWVQP
jgi:pyridoxamine 5'-phosphate oxidase